MFWCLQVLQCLALSATQTDDNEVHSWAVNTLRNVAKQVGGSRLRRQWKQVEASTGVAWGAILGARIITPGSSLSNSFESHSSSFDSHNRSFEDGPPALAPALASAPSPVPTPAPVPSVNSAAAASSSGSGLRDRSLGMLPIDVQRRRHSEPSVIPAPTPEPPVADAQAPTLGRSADCVGRSAPERPCVACATPPLPPKPPHAGRMAAVAVAPATPPRTSEDDLISDLLSRINRLEGELSEVKQRGLLPTSSAPGACAAPVVTPTPLAPMPVPVAPAPTAAPGAKEELDEQLIAACQRWSTEYNQRQHVEQQLQEVEEDLTEQFNTILVAERGKHQVLSHGICVASVAAPSVSSASPLCTRKSQNGSCQGAGVGVRNFPQFRRNFPAIFRNSVRPPLTAIPPSPGHERDWHVVHNEGMIFSWRVRTRRNSDATPVLASQLKAGALAVVTDDCHCGGCMLQRRDLEYLQCEASWVPRRHCANMAALGLWAARKIRGKGA